MCTWPFSVLPHEPGLQLPCGALTTSRHHAPPGASGIRLLALSSAHPRCRAKSSFQPWKPLDAAKRESLARP